MIIIRVDPEAVKWMAAQWVNSSDASHGDEDLARWEAEVWIRLYEEYKIRREQDSL